MKYTPQEVRKAMLEQDLRVLVPIVKELVRKAKGHPIHVGHVRRAAENRGILLASTAPRYVAIVYGQVMQRAGLVRTGQYVRTMRIGKKGGNLVSQWRRAA